MYTCIAYLIEIRKFCSKTWFIKVLILRFKNALKLYNVSTSTFNFQKIRGYTPGSPLKGGGEGRGEGEEREEAREGRPPIHIPGYATATHSCTSQYICVNVYSFFVFL